MAGPVQLVNPEETMFLPAVAEGVGRRHSEAERPAIPRPDGAPPLQEILRSNDPVLLSFVQATLTGEGVEHMVVDSNMSVLQGSLGILAARVLVPDDQEVRARRVLSECGIAHELRPQTP